MAKKATKAAVQSKYDLLTVAEKKSVDNLVRHYLDNDEGIRRFHKVLLGYVEESKALKPLVHSVRARLKEPSHLQDKLARKILKTKETGVAFDITEENIFVKINDLSGIRILHLHTHQFKKIDEILKAILANERVPIIEGPVARTWDNEYKKVFEDFGIQTISSPDMYTSVHYVVNSGSEVPVTSELQVRTLMEEVWGEVDHTFNYPHPVPYLSCREQLRALARVTSGATRLVDSIFASYDDLKDK